MSRIDFDLKKIKALLFDVDGVLSPSSIPMYPNGEPMRMVNIKDGYALQLAVKKGLTVGIISGANTIAIETRFKVLGLTYIYLGAQNKVASLEDFLSKSALSADQILYMGDDIPDIPVMKKVALPCCPKDAADDVKEICRYISPYKGGEGAGRDVLEQVLKAQSLWMNDSVAFGW